jgi:2-haloacid dehalogenase
MKLSDFSTLSFDCYGTLIDWESGLLQALEPLRARSPRVPGAEALLAAFGEAEAAAQAQAPAKLYPDILGDALRSVAAGWRIEVDDADAARFGRSVGDWPAFPDSAAALAYLKRHYRLVILSNVDRASFARSNAQLGVTFHHVFTAQDIGSYKPDLRNFRYMLDRLEREGVAATQVLHVAQSLFHDHVPAKQLGLATVWVDRRAGKTGSGATPPAQAKPDRVVSSLAELVELHRRENARV